MGIAKSIAGSSSSPLAPAPPVSSGWDPAFNIVGYTVGPPDNKVATHVGGNATESIIGILSHDTTGTFYFEVDVENVFGNLDAFVGIAQAGASSTNFIGHDAFGWGYRGTGGTKWTNNVSAAYGSAYDTGTIIGVTVDFDLGNLNFSFNGVDQGVAFTGITFGTVFPAGTLFFDTGYLQLHTALADFNFFPGGLVQAWG